MSSGRASRYVRNPDSQARQDDSHRKAGPKAARTYATMTEARAAAESSARLLGRLLCRTGTGRLFLRCDKRLGVARDGRFVFLACEECCDCGVKAPRSWPRQHHDGQPDAVERFGEVEQVAEPIGAIDWLPRTYAFDSIECNGPNTNHEEPERREYGQ